MDITRPSKFEDRFRLYVDESGDHVFGDTDSISHRYLCLVGCWFKNPAYIEFHQSLEALKSLHLPYHPDDPVVLHREEILHARSNFHVLRDESKRTMFDGDLLSLIEKSEFRLVAVVIDKKSLRSNFGAAAAHPYHLALGFLLQRYVGFLNRIGRVGDVMAESRGGKEDRLLKESFQHVYNRGVWVMKPNAFQAALTSHELKLKQKTKNIAGLQLSDILGHPIKHYTLRHFGQIGDQPSLFAQRLMEIASSKLNRHFSDGRVEGYGIVLYPR